MTQKRTYHITIPLVIPLCVTVESEAEVSEEEAHGAVRRSSYGPCLEWVE